MDNKINNQDNIVFSTKFNDKNGKPIRTRVTTPIRYLIEKRHDVISMATDTLLKATLEKMHKVLI